MSESDERTLLSVLNKGMEEACHCDIPSDRKAEAQNTFRDCKEAITQLAKMGSEVGIETIAYVCRECTGDGFRESGILDHASRILTTCKHPLAIFHTALLTEDVEEVCFVVSHHPSLTSNLIELSKRGKDLGSSEAPTLLLLQANIAAKALRILQNETELQIALRDRKLKIEEAKHKKIEQEEAHQDALRREALEAKETYDNRRAKRLCIDCGVRLGLCDKILSRQRHANCELFDDNSPAVGQPAFSKWKLASGIVILMVIVAAVAGISYYFWPMDQQLDKQDASADHIALLDHIADPNEPEPIAKVTEQETIVDSNSSGSDPNSIVTEKSKSRIEEFAELADQWLDDDIAEAEVYALAAVRKEVEEKVESHVTAIEQLEEEPDSLVEDGAKVEAKTESEVAMQLEAQDDTEQEVKARAKLEGQLEAKTEQRPKVEIEATEALAAARAELDEKAKSLAVTIKQLEEELKAQTEEKNRAQARVESETKARLVAEESADEEAKARAVLEEQLEDKTQPHSQTEAETAEALAAARAELDVKAKSYAATIKQLEQELKAQTEERTRAEAKAESETKARAEAEKIAGQEVEARAALEEKLRAETEQRSKVEAGAAEALAAARAESDEKVKSYTATIKQLEQDLKAQTEERIRAQAKAESETKARVEAEKIASEEATARAAFEEQLKVEIEQRSKIEGEAAEALAAAKAELDVKAESYVATIKRLLEQEATQNKMDGLIQLLGDKEPSMRSSAMEALEQTGAQAVPYLIVALEDERWVVREHSAETLGRISDRRAVEPLLSALEDDNVWVRKSAGESLSLIGDEQAITQAIESLEKSLRDENAHVRRVATAGLDTIRSNVTKKDQVSESSGKQAGSIIGKLIELKLYTGIGIGVILLTVGLTIVFVSEKRRREGLAKHILEL